MHKPTESPEQVKMREYRERTKILSADRLLTYEVYSLRLAVEAHSENTGKRIALLETAVAAGLAAIALAASTPEDNSAAVKEFTDRINKQVELLKSAKPI